MELLQKSIGNLLPNGESIIIGIVLLVGAGLLAYILKVLFNKLIKARFDIPLIVELIVDIFAFSLFFAGLLFGIRAAFGVGLLKEALSSIGLLSIVLGFAFKDIGENFVAGILLAFSRPFAKDDYIEVNDVLGQVKDITIRTTLVLTPEGKEIYIPNSSLIKNNLHSLTFKGALRYGFTINMDIGYDYKAIKRIIHKAVVETEGVLRDGKKSTIYIRNIENVTTTIQINFWVNTIDFEKTSEHNQIKSRVIENVIDALEANDIPLANDILDVNLLKEN